MLKLTFGSPLVGSVNVYKMKDFHLDNEEKYRQEIPEVVLREIFDFCPQSCPPFICNFFRTLWENRINLAATKIEMWYRRNRLPIYLRLRLNKFNFNESYMHSIFKNYTKLEWIRYARLHFNLQEFVQIPEVCLTELIHFHGDLSDSAKDFATEFYKYKDLISSIMTLDYYNKRIRNIVMKWVLNKGMVSNSILQSAIKRIRWY